MKLIERCGSTDKDVSIEATQELLDILCDISTGIIRDKVTFNYIMPHKNKEFYQFESYIDLDKKYARDNRIDIIQHCHMILLNNLIEKIINSNIMQPLVILLKLSPLTDCLHDRFGWHGTVTVAECLVTPP